MVTPTTTHPAPMNQQRVKEIADLLTALNPQEQQAVELLVERQRIINLKFELEQKQEEISAAEEDLRSLIDQRDDIAVDIRLVEIKEDFFYNRISSKCRELFLEHPLANSREEIEGDHKLTDKEIREFYQKLSISGSISFEDALYFFGFKRGTHLCRLYTPDNLTGSGTPYRDRWTYDKTNKEFRLV